jgi:hypothetical protein
VHRYSGLDTQHRGFLLFFLSFVQTWPSVPYSLCHGQFGQERNRKEGKKRSAAIRQRLGFGPLSATRPFLSLLAIQMLRIRETSLTFSSAVIWTGQ